MSFSFQFVARSRVHARQKLDRITHIPEPVRAFIICAIDRLRDTDEVRVIKVSASGNLRPADADYASDDACASIDVRSIAATD